MPGELERNAGWVTERCGIISSFTVDDNGGILISAARGWVKPEMTSKFNPLTRILYLSAVGNFRQSLTAQKSFDF